MAETPIDPSSSPSGFIRSTVQRRSGATAQRILDAATDLFGRGRLDETPVAEIARAAGVSVGGFYGRFETKAHLQRAVAESMMHRLFAPFDELLGRDRIVGVDARTIVRRFATGLVRVFGGRDREAVRRVVMLVRSDTDLPASRAIRELNRSVQDRLTRALLERRAEIDHPDPETAVHFADLAMSASAREALLHGGTGLRISESDLVDRLTDLGCAYLRIA